MRIFALWLGKLAYILMRITKHHGAALPGLVAEKICPRFLSSSLDQLPEGVVIITGTNGKTTSTKMLSAVLKNQMRVLTNPTGSNFTRGVASAIVKHSKLNGKLPYEIGVFELDEAYAAKFADEYSPRATIVLNVMRDQMDRFGEIDHTAKLISKIVSKTTGFVVLNQDDQRVSNMKDIAKSQVSFFGVSEKLRNLYKNDDELHNVEKIDSKTKKVDCLLESIDANGAASFVINNEELSVNLKASTTYNALNAAAVILTASTLGLSNEGIIGYLANVKPAFGRGEHIKIAGKKCILQLVKNPGGFRQALISGKSLNNDATMIVINDDYADGRDVSWLWDVDFKSIDTKQVITSGKRAADMALRLKYDEIPVDLIEPELTTALKHLLESIKEGQTAVIYTTYTAMLKLRKIISKITEVEKI